MLKGGLFFISFVNVGGQLGYSDLDLTELKP